MLRTLLAERFRLAVRHETKEATVYELGVAKNGFKIAEAAGPGGIRFLGAGQIEGMGSTIDGLAGYLQSLLGQVVLNKTRLKATYTFKLTWTPDEAQAGRPGAQVIYGKTADEHGPSIFTALQEQLGLKLESAKGPVDTLVLDHAEKPAAD